MQRKIKVILVATLIVIATVFSLMLSACGEGGTRGLQYTLSDDGTYYVVTGIEKQDIEKLVIPAEYKGIPVKAIGSKAFERCYNLESITIPSSVTTIGDRAFSRCSSLSTIVIPEGVTTIGTLAFSNCGELDSVSLPSSLTTLQGAPFFESYTLQNIDFNGTTAQWDSIEKVDNWHTSMSVALTVTCTDGVIETD